MIAEYATRIAMSTWLIFTYYEIRFKNFYIFTKISKFGFINIPAPKPFFKLNRKLKKRARLLIIQTFFFFADSLLVPSLHL